ncbi:MAG: hypothetical protein ACR2LH_01200 [Thermoleophilaceae bacterium]
MLRLTAADTRGGESQAGRRRGNGTAPEGLRPVDLLAAFFGLGIAFLVIAAFVAGIHAAGGWSSGRWLALHLAFVGGVSQLVLGASQFFVCAFLATTPPPRALVRGQLAAWNLGTVLVTAGVTSRSDVMTDAGAALLVIGLVLLVAGLRSMQRRSLQRAAWAGRWYYACAALLALGVLAGALLARGAAWPLGSLLGAHLALNVAGWFGTAIVGTLHTFYPSLTKTRLRFPRLQAPAFAAWVSGAGALACGYGFDTAWLALSGWVGLTLGATLLAVNLLAATRRAPAPLPLPARLVAVGQGFLIAGLLVGLVLALDQGLAAPLVGAERSAVAVLLLAGWLGLTVLGSLLHLLSVLLRARDLTQPHPSPLRDGALPTLAVLGVLGVAGAQLPSVEPLATPAAAALALVYLLLMARVVRLAARALRHGELSI